MRKTKNAFKNKTCTFVNIRKIILEQSHSHNSPQRRYNIVAEITSQSGI